MEQFPGRESVFVRPFILRKKSVHHFFHRKILNQLFLSKFDASHWIKMTDTCQMLFDVLSFVCDAWRCYNWIDENFKTNFSTQIVGHITFLSRIKTNNQFIIALAIVQFSSWLTRRLSSSFANILFTSVRWFSCHSRKAFIIYFLNIFQKLISNPISINWLTHSISISDACALVTSSLTVSSLTILSLAILFCISSLINLFM